MTGTPVIGIGAGWRNPTFYRATTYAQGRPWHRTRLTGDTPAPVFPALPPVAHPIIDATGHLLLPCRRLRWRQCTTCYVVVDLAAFARDVLRQVCLAQPLTGLCAVDLGQLLALALTPVARTTGHRTAVGLLRAARRGAGSSVAAATAARHAGARAAWRACWPTGQDPTVRLACAEQCLDVYHALQPSVHRMLIAASWEPTFGQLYAATVGITDPAVQADLLAEPRTVRGTRSRAHLHRSHTGTGARS